MDKVRLKIPATSANLGPGFDVIGCALNLYNFLTVKISSETTCRFSGMFDESLKPDTNNLIYRSIKRIYQELDQQIPNLEIISEINIPLSRGLGSSSSAIIGGLSAANFLTGEQLSPADLLNIATEIEGHPDNVAPCLIGGIVLSLVENGKVQVSKIDTNLPLSFIVIIPEFKLSTAKARAILPEKIPLKDCVKNISYISFLISGFQKNNPDFLRLALKDLIHQPYRGQLIPGFKEVINVAGEKGALGAVLSGAGPTILALTEKNETEIAEAMKETFLSKGIRAQSLILKIDQSGTVIA